jgi:HK97 family phage prohead protease
MKQKVCTTTVSPLMDRKMSFTISTAAIDRDGDTIDPKGWELDNYKRSPVVLWAHDHTTPPIGRASNLWTDAKGLHATVEFPPRGIHALADQVHDLVKAGFLSATSVGFIPKESRPIKTGQAITRAELLEFSICSIPSNPQALVLQRSYDRAAVAKWLDQDATVDLNAIFESQEPEIDWDRISLPSAGVEVNVTTADVDRVVSAFAPVLLAGVRAGLRLQARIAAEAAINHMTGRLD